MRAPRLKRVLNVRDVALFTVVAVFGLRNLATAALVLPDFEVEKEWDGWPEGSVGFDFDTALERYARSDKDGNVSTRQMNYEPFDFPAVHITKIEDYKIHEQEAMGYRLPYMSSNGWSRFLR